MKNAVTLDVPPQAHSEPVRAADGRTRDRVITLLLERGSATAAELGKALGLSPAGIRRHLDVMLAEGMVIVRNRPVRGHRGRGRPAKVFALTDAARLSCAPHTYDDLASAALRWIARNGGSEAVTRFAAEQVSVLEERCRAAMADANEEPLARASALARALSAEGYAASATTIASGGQLCQHNCPVAHVAAEFPQLCEAETEVISRLVGTHVQRLATIANGDGVCTTHIPGTTHTSGAMRIANATHIPSLPGSSPELPAGSIDARRPAVPRNQRPRDVEAWQPARGSEEGPLT